MSAPPSGSSAEPFSVTSALWLARVTAGLFAAFAGVIHLLYAPAHFDDRSDVGLFFVIVGVDQLAAGFLLIWGPPSLLIAAVTLAGTLAVMAIYIVSRTVGLPFGPDSGEVEAVGILDLLATFFEAITAAFLALVVAVSAFGRRADVSSGLEERV